MNQRGEKGKKEDRNVKDRQTEIDRETDRHRDRQTETQRDRDRQRQRKFPCTMKNKSANQDNKAQSTER